MARVALTISQEEDALVSKLGKMIVEKLTYYFVVKRCMNKGQTAKALGIHPNTWRSWRINGLSDDVAFRDVVCALRRAGYTIEIKSIKGE